MENENRERKTIRNFIKKVEEPVGKIRDLLKKKEPIKKIRNLIKVNKPVGIAVTVLVCLILVGVSYTVYAKYYKTGFNKGMATASGFYFNSNYMASVDGLDVAGAEDMVNIPNDVLESVIVSANPNVWTGLAPYPFNVEVRNYDNQLLYNDRDLNVEYEVLFMLADKPVGATYFVQPSDGSVEQPIEMKYEDENGDRAVYSFRGTLPGGQTNQDTYIVSIKLDEADIYEPINVLMVAYPIGPEYLQGTKSIAGMLQATVQEREFSIEKANFTICEREEYMSTAFAKWKEDVILKESGFVYQIYTSGNFSGSGSATRKTIQLIWRADMLKINNYDPYYQALMELKTKGEDISERYYKADVTEVKDEKGVTTDITVTKNSAGQWQVMEIDVLPYASLKFTFFRVDGDETTPGFVDAIKKSTDRDVFENSVRVRLLEEESSNP